MTGMACPHGCENADYCPNCIAESDAVWLRAENERLRAELVMAAQTIRASSLTAKQGSG